MPHPSNTDAYLEYLRKQQQQQQQTASSSNTPYSGTLAQAITDATKYASQGYAQKFEVADSLTGNSMYMPKAGDIKSFDFDTARTAVMERAKAMAAMSATGLYNLPVFAYDSKYINMPQTSYLQELLAGLDKQVAESIAADEANRNQVASNMEVARRLKEINASGDYYHTVPFFSNDDRDLLDIYEGDEELFSPIIKDWMALYALTNPDDANAPKTYDDWRNLDDDEYYKWADTWHQNWLNADFNNLGLTNYNSQTDLLQGRQKMVQDELDRRSAIEEIEAFAHGMADFDTQSVWKNVYAPGNTEGLEGGPLLAHVAEYG